MAAMLHLTPYATVPFKIIKGVYRAIHHNQLGCQCGPKIDSKSLQDLHPRTTKAGGGQMAAAPFVILSYGLLLHTDDMQGCDNPHHLDYIPRITRLSKLKLKPFVAWFLAESWNGTSSIGFGLRRCRICCCFCICRVLGCQFWCPNPYFGTLRRKTTSKQMQARTGIRS